MCALPYDRGIETKPSLVKPLTIGRPRNPRDVRAGGTLVSQNRTAEMVYFIKRCGIRPLGWRRTSGAAFSVAALP